ncbi:hypothetical protein RUA4292_03997 [Ruegeria atlantica]|uniref:DUF3302 domain-containing protein n=1 Tax=Ruegeria atlantica TaxID=81569 RepID=A0A0P1F2A3_9RHOB|nr:hypothetical protein RUA4292_03997 [Ruegeria atlantica]
MDTGNEAVTGISGLVFAVSILMIIVRPPAADDRRYDAAPGVHWFWWVFWTVLFWPALLIVYFVHTGKKSAGAALAKKEIESGRG